MIGFLFLEIPGIMGVVVGYMLCRFRFPKPARDFAHDLKTASVEAVHIGSDNRMRLLGGRRGSTGRLHFPNMEIISDSVHKAAYPFCSFFGVIISTHLDTPLIPEFVEIGQQLLLHSDQIGADGRKKDARQIMYVLEEMKEQEDRVQEIEKLNVQIDAKAITLGDYLYKRYDRVIFPEADGKLDQKKLKEITDQYNAYLANDGAWVKVERERLKKARQISVTETDFSIEYETDNAGVIRGAHLLRHTVLDLTDIRNFWPGGGTAEDGYLSGEHAKLGAQDMKGEHGWSAFLKWFGPFMLMVGFGIMVYIIAQVLHIT